MHSAWPWWAKALLAGLIIIALPLGVGGWWGQHTARAIAATAPLRAACQVYIKQAWKLEGHIESPPDDAASVTVHALPPNLKRLSATFLETPRYVPSGSAPPNDRQFECTLRPAGTGYTVAGFRWLH